MMHGFDRRAVFMLGQIKARTEMATFATQDGIVALVEKAAEIKPNVALWWSAESQMEQSMKNGDVIGGQYYLDVANLMMADGLPIQPLFPKEGNPQDYGSWCLSSLSDKSAEAAEFINFSSDPATQALMSRMIGTAPPVTMTSAGFSSGSLLPMSSLSTSCPPDGV